MTRILSLPDRIGPQPSRPRDPFTVERYPAPNGGVRLLGYDGNGEPAVELTLPFDRYTAHTMIGFREWLVAEGVLS